MKVINDSEDELVLTCCERLFKPPCCAYLSNGGKTALDKPWYSFERIPHKRRIHVLYFTIWFHLFIHFWVGYMSDV